MAKYIYSIIQGAAQKTLRIPGIEEKQVYSMRCRDLGVIVSDSSIMNFDNLSKEEIQNCIAAHQKVNEELLKECDVVPMAFGMVAEKEEEVTHILDKAYLQFKRALKKVENKTEFVVHAFWEEKTILNDLLNSNQDVKRLRAEARSKGKIRGLAARIKLGKLVMELVKVRREHLCREIEEKLKGCCSDMKQEKLRSEDMILNLSLLVDKFHEVDLDKRMRSIGEEYKDKLRFKYIGPMPPYSFAHINLSLGNFELLDNARKILGIQERATFADIKGIYLGLARKYHPDRHEYTNDPRILAGMTQKMKEIQEAYEALESYCRCVSPESALDSYSFRKEDVEQSLVIQAA